MISLFPIESLDEWGWFQPTLRACHAGDYASSPRAQGPLGVNPYYYLIHTTMDNADSAHAVMAK